MRDYLLEDVRAEILGDSNLGAIVGDRVYAGQAPRCAPGGGSATDIGAHIVYSSVSRIIDRNLADHNGLRERRVQFDLWAQSSSTLSGHACVEEMNDYLVELFRATPRLFNSRTLVEVVNLVADVGDYEPEDRYYRLSTDFMFFYQIELN